MTPWGWKNWEGGVSDWEGGGATPEIKQEQEHGSFIQLVILILFKSKEWSFKHSHNIFFCIQIDYLSNIIKME